MIDLSIDIGALCVGGYTCPWCGQHVLMNSSHACSAILAGTTNITSDTTIFEVEPPLLSLKELMEEIGCAGYHCFVRYDPERESNCWTVMITSQQGRRDTDDPVGALRKMWSEFALQSQKNAAFQQA